jgi:predicted GNAT family N-acyltransferase
MKIETRSHLSEDQIDDLHRMYQAEWWTEGRERDDIVTMLDGSDYVVAFCDAQTETLVAFSRILTDTVYKALIFDVIVSAEHRGNGLGRMLMDAIIEHPALSEVEHFELYCLEEMVPFYENWEFSDELGELRLMRRD